MHDFPSRDSDSVDSPWERELVSSRYTITVPLKDGGSLAYNALSGGLAVWSPAEREAFESLPIRMPAGDRDTRLDALAGGGYVVDSRVDELALLEGDYKSKRFDPRLMTLTIAPTLACNFGCDYCFQGQEKAAETMSPAVQDAIIALVERVSGKIDTLGIAWYGGEPTTRLDVLESLSDRLIALCDREEIKYEAMMVTNGFKLNPEVARALHARRVTTIQVTLDGPPDYHDQRRVLLSGKGTFDKIVGNIETWIDDIPIGISVRVNIDERNRENIRALLDELADRGLGNKKNLGVYFAPIEAITEGCHVISDVTMSKSKYGQLEAELHRYAYEKGLAQLPYPPRFRGTCAAVRPKGFVIVPNGDVHKCWDTVSWPEKKVGTIFEPDALNEDERVLKWMRWTPFENDTCRNCRILPVCAGSCAYKFLHSEETRGEAAILPCPSWKYNIKERLVLRAEASGGISADDYDPEMIRTDPSELCADVWVSGGKALPDSMQAEYRAASAAAPV